MKAKHFFSKFWRDRRANVGMMTGLVAFPLIVASGLSIEYGTYVNAKIALDKAAASCTEAASANWQSMVRLNPSATPGELQSAALARGQAAFDAEIPSNLAGTYTVESVVAKSGDGMASGCTYRANIPTVFAGMIGIQSVGADGSAKSSITLVPASAAEPGYLLREKFDQAGTPAAGANAWRGLTTYNGWSIQVGIEVGSSQIYGPPPPSGQYNVAELSGTNRGIAKKVYLSPGQYELRYYVRNRETFADYDPVVLCGSQSSDVDWADTTQYKVKSDRFGVYLQTATGSTAPASYSPTGGSLIDVCLYVGERWIERSVKIRINTPSDYWLAFQSEGALDGLGPVLSDIRLCLTTCPGTITRYFPWTGKTALYKDGFEVPRWYVWETALDLSGLTPGWTNAPGSWATWPYNQVDFQNGGYNGTYALELDGSGPQADLNRSISRKLLLPAGYYALKYYYKSAMLMASVSLCGLSSVDSDVATVNSVKWEQVNGDSFIVRTYIDSDLLVSHPEVPESLNAIPTWKDPSGSAATLPRLPKTAVDACTYSDTWRSRTINFKITKPAYYWLTMQAAGTPDAQGGTIDEVVLSSLGDLSTAAPASVVTIPAAGTPVGSTITLGPVEIVAQ